MFSTRSSSLGLMLVFLLLTACSRDENEPPSEVFFPKRYDPHHIVCRGETLEDIAARYRMAVSELIELNGIDTSRPLVPGRKLLIHPGKQAELVPPPSTTVTVETDTLPESEIIEDENTQKENSSPSPQKEEGLTFDWPLDGKIISHFGELTDGIENDGIYIKGAAGLPVKAAADGTIDKTTNKIPEYGNMIVIKHLDGKVTIYAHLKEILVKVGTLVSKGKKIGSVGKTGNVTEPQLFFQIRLGDAKLTPVNPETFLPKKKGILISKTK